jgi:hypothetical protein
VTADGREAPFELKSRRRPRLAGQSYEKQTVQPPPNILLHGHARDTHAILTARHVLYTNAWNVVGIRAINR